MSYSLAQEIRILAFAVAGMSLKLADNYGTRSRGYLSAAVSAICMGFLLSDSSASSSIILGIIVGVTLAGKVDQGNLLFGLCLTLVSAAVLGFTLPDPSLLAVVLVAALLDEKGHEKITSGGVLTKFFRYRMFLKLVMATLAVFKMVDMISAVGFFCFDVAYDLTDLIWASFHEEAEVDNL